MTEYSDEQLLKMFREGRDDAAFSGIVKKYQQKLYYHIRRMVKSHDDADDVLQNTFIKAWAGLKNFREEANLYTWLYRIATNETLTFLSKNKRVVMVDADKTLGRQHAPEHGEGGDEIYRKLQQAIDTLPDKQKIVFNMKYFDEMQYDEMSAILETSVGALKASYHHAVKKIEDFLTSR